MKKLLCLLLVVLSLMGCSQNPKTKELSLNAYLLQNAELAAQELIEPVSNGDVITMMAYDQLEDEIKNMIAGMQGEPNAAMIITMAPEMTAQLPQLFDSSIELNELESLYFSRRILRSVPTMITGQAGSEMFAAASMLVNDKSAVSHGELKENTAVLFLHDNGYGTYTAFLPAEDGTVLMASAGVKFPEDADMERLEDVFHQIEEIMNVKLFEVTYIEKPDMIDFLNE